MTPPSDIFKSGTSELNSPDDLKKGYQKNNRKLSILSAEKRWSKLILTSFLAILMGFSAFFKPALQYPSLELSTPENVQLAVLLNPASNAKDCHQMLFALVNSFQTTCPTCLIRKQQCLQALTPQQQTLLSSEPLPHASARMPNGVATYNSPNPDIALDTCQKTEHQSATGSGRITCHAANTSRSIPDPVNNGLANDLKSIFLILAAAGAASWFICYLMIRYKHLHAHLSNDLTDAGPQKFHAVPTPRIGGLGLFGGLLAGAGLVLMQSPESSPAAEDFGYLLLAALPVLSGGLLEDFTRNVGVAQRLLLSMISAAIGIWLLGAVVNRMGIPIMDNAMQWLPFAIAFTVFAVGGVTHSINIIDGYNGLAGGFTVIVLIAMAAVAAQVNDNLILLVSLSLIGATLGFLAWNWPEGKIFMGDGGAYLLGFILAELSVLLVYRNPSVSPWFPLVLLAYPVIETLFSIYRRKWLHHSTPGNPDAQHLHQFLFIRIARGHSNGSGHQMITRNNSRVAPYLWSVAAIASLFAVQFWQTTPILMMASFIGCVLYVLYYHRLIKIQGFGRVEQRN